MSNKIILEIAKTEIKKFTVDLDDWYDYNKMSLKEKHNQIQDILDNFGELYDDGGINLIETTDDWDLMNWELEDEQN